MRILYQVKMFGQLRPEIIVLIINFLLLVAALEIGILDSKEHRILLIDKLIRKLFFLWF